MRWIFIPLLFALASLSSCGGQAEHSVLFVGNSYTFANDLPEMVAEIAAANDTTIDVEMIAIGGAFLHEHAVNPDVIEALGSGTYDTVVFQEQSVAPSLPAFAEENTIPAALTLDAIADAAGIRVIWFQTWGHVDGFPSEGHDSYESMQTAVIATYDEIASRAGGTIARVGETWQDARWAISTPLYAEDGTHPSPAGSYLAALEISEAVLGAPLSDFPSAGDVEEDTALALANA